MQSAARITVLQTLAYIGRESFHVELVTRLTNFDVSRMNSTYGFGYGEDAKQQMLDDAHELRLQLEYEEKTMRPEVGLATAMLFRAGTKHIKAADAELLATDIMGVAAELAGETGDPAFHVKDGARALEKRIGGLERLEGYMKILRAGASKDAA